MIINNISELNNIDRKNNIKRRKNFNGKPPKINLLKNQKKLNEYGFPLNKIRCKKCGEFINFCYYNNKYICSCELK